MHTRVYDFGFLALTALLLHAEHQQHQSNSGISLLVGATILVGAVIAGTWYLSGQYIDSAS